MPQGLNESMISNAILYAGQPEIQELEVETTTQFCPGKLVITGTDQWQCGPAGDASTVVIGVADVPSDETISGYYTPSLAGTVTKAFTATDQIRVLRGDIVVKLIAKSAETIVVGTKVVAAANGMIKAGATAGQVVGYSLEKATTRIAATCDWVLVKLTI
jgi:hypothetical protein